MTKFIDTNAGDAHAVAACVRVIEAARRGMRVERADLAMIEALSA